MAKRHRGRRGQRESERQEDRPELDGTAIARQVGQFEASTGLAHGPGVVLVAAAAALLVLPM